MAKEYICPYCGTQAVHLENCLTCHAKIDWVEKVWLQSDLLYNKGYESAKSRHLSDAITYLGGAVKLNKYHTKARNLLGLVYYEVGRLGEALTAWIIAHSLDKEDTLSGHYINIIPKERRTFANEKE